MTKNNIVKKNKIKKKPKKKYWKYKNIPNKKIKIANEVNKGQGLLGTIWKGVNWEYFYKINSKSIFLKIYKKETKFKIKFYSIFLIFWNF